MTRRTAVVYRNGRFLPAREATVSALDRGLLYGDGLFETILVRAGKPVALAAHLERLRQSARALRLPVPDDDETWRRRVTALVRRNGLERDDAAVRLTLTRGIGGDGLLPPARPRPTVLLTVRPLDPALPRLRRRGVRVELLPFHPGLAGLLAGVKTTDYLTAMIGKQRARRAGAFEGIYTGGGGEVFEGTTSNLFVVRRGRLATPPLAAGILPGVTRAQVLRIAREEGIAVVERRLRRADLLGADEAFLTASTIGVLPIRAVGRHRLRRHPGPVTSQIQGALRRLQD